MRRDAEAGVQSLCIKKGGKVGGGVVFAALEQKRFQAVDVCLHWGVAPDHSEEQAAAELELQRGRVMAPLSAVRGWNLSLLRV